jgi:8-oxo-dGTP diphosphatase
MFKQIFKQLLDFIENVVRWFVIMFTNWLPVKVIRDDKGIPFLYRYHLFALTNDGPGVCIHHFVKSDPDRGYHDHPWNRGLSFILCGGYDERIVEKGKEKGIDGKPKYVTHRRDRFTFNHLNGADIYHRVMIEEGKDAWTLFFFQKRSKTWGMLSLDGEYKPMSTTVNDQDGGWWNHVMKGLGLHQRLKHKGNIVATADAIVIAESKILLIKRGKEPYKGRWAFPGGRIEHTDNDLVAAAQRELREETHLQNIDLKFCHVVGNSKRDPRGFCLTVVFIAQLDKIPQTVKAGDDAVEYAWFSLKNLPEMAFDHREILDNALKVLK